MGGRQGTVHQTMSPIFPLPEKGKEPELWVYYKENLESPCLGRSIYRSFSSTHELKCRFFCHMAAGTCFLGKVRAGLSFRLVKTILLAVAEVLGS